MVETTYNSTWRITDDSEEGVEALKQQMIDNFNALILSLRERHGDDAVTVEGEPEFSVAKRDGFVDADFLRMNVRIEVDEDKISVRGIAATPLPDPSVEVTDVPASDQEA